MNNQAQKNWIKRQINYLRGSALFDEATQEQLIVILSIIEMQHDRIEQLENALKAVQEEQQ